MKPSRVKQNGKAERKVQRENPDVLIQILGSWLI